jgi:lipopolysaccharide transport system permease protein
MSTGANYFQLIYQLTKRDVTGRYKGSVLGIFWSFVNPLLMLTVYTVFFSVILKIKWGNSGESQVDFSLLLFVGLIMYGFIAECINRAPGLVTGNVNYVKKVVFPIAVLPVVSCGSALFHWLISMVVLILALLVSGHGIQATSLFVVPLMVPMVLYGLGIGWVLASIGVFLRDLSQVVGVISQALMFMSPVFFSVSKIPASYRGFFLANPLTTIIDQARDVLILGRPLDWAAVTTQVLIGSIVCAIGFAWFQYTKRGFADVL